jgi:hypothetical protein
MLEQALCKKKRNHQQLTCHATEMPRKRLIMEPPATAMRNSKKGPSPCKDHTTSRFCEGYGRRSLANAYLRSSHTTFLVGSSVLTPLVVERHPQAQTVQRCIRNKFDPRRFPGLHATSLDLYDCIVSNTSQQCTLRATTWAVIDLPPSVHHDSYPRPGLANHVVAFGQTEESTSSCIWS